MGRVYDLVTEGDALVVVLDYGMGNVGSILNMLKKIGTPARAASQPDDLQGATRLILPGVGSFDAAMENLEKSGLNNAIEERVMEAGVPILGICLGMQLLARSSEEGVRRGLGWIAADCIRFRFAAPSMSFKVPHMGWNTVNVLRPGVLFSEDPGEQRFYFVHSYHVRCDHAEDVIAEAHHGVTFHAAVGHGHIFGVQFHPEKSHRFGLELLKRFAQYPC